MISINEAFRRRLASAVEKAIPLMNEEDGMRVCLLMAGLKERGNLEEEDFTEMMDIINRSMKASSLLEAAEVPDVGVRRAKDTQNGEVQNAETIRNNMIRYQLLMQIHSMLEHIRKQNGKGIQRTIAQGHTKKK